MLRFNRISNSFINYFVRADIWHRLTTAASFSIDFFKSIYDRS